jgi:hypothetical protein
MTQVSIHDMCSVYAAAASHSQDSAARYVCSSVDCPWVGQFVLAIHADKAQVPTVICMTPAMLQASIFMVRFQPRST